MATCPRYLNPQAEHLLDWFHITMRITVLTQLAKGLRCPLEMSTDVDVAAQLQRVKWFLWHGNVFRALHTVDDLTTDLAVPTPSSWTSSPRRSASSAATSQPTPPVSRTTVNAGSPARPSPPRSWNPQSTRSTANAWSKSSRCDGPPVARTCYSRSAPGSSTAPSPTTTDAGTPASPTPRTGRTRPDSLPRFVPLSRRGAQRTLVS